MRITSWILSLALHVLVACLGYWAAVQPPVKVRLDVPVYQVDLVRLAPARPAPKAVAKAAPKAAPKVTPVPVARPEPKPKAKAISAKERPKAKPKAVPAPKPKAEPKPRPKPKKPAKPQPSRKEIMAKALAQAKALAKAQAKAKERARAETLQKELEDLRGIVARDALARAADGNATQGMADARDEAYSLMVVEAIRANWRYPSLPTDQDDLAATVEIRVAPDGTISDYRLSAASGRPEFDASVLKAVAETEMLPAPRPGLEMLHVTFNLSQLR